MKSLLIAAAFLAAAASPALACGPGGSPDPAATVKTHIATIDARLQDEGSPQTLDAATVSRVKELRRESADLLASALAQRSRTGERSPLAAKRIEAAREKAGQALLALGIPATSAQGPIFRCGIPNRGAAQS
jgi:hypothetical protein